MTSPTVVVQSKTISTHRVRLGYTKAWYVAVGGIIAGLLLTEAGMRIEGGAIAVLSLAPLLTSLDRRLFQGLLFGPLTLIYLYHALGYGIGPLWQVHGLGWFTAIEDGFAPAQWGAVLGLVALALTFPKVFQAVLQRVADREGLHEAVAPDCRWHSYGLLMLLVAVVLIGYGFATGAANRLDGQETPILISSITVGIQNVHQVMFFFLGYSAARCRGRWMFLWCAVLALYAMFFFLDGARGTVATAAILSGIGLVWGGVLRRRVLMAGMLAVTAFLPIAGVVLTYRDFYADRPRTFSGRISGLMDAADDYFGTHTSLASFTAIFTHNVTAQSVDRVFLLTPEAIPFAGMEDLDQVVLTFVPRFIWPDRPDPLNGNDLAILYGAALPDTSGSYMPAVGEGYRRAGWIGVILLYAFSASIYGSVTALCWARRKDREWMAMLVFATYQSIGVWSASLLSNFNLALWVFPKYWILFWLLRRLQDGLTELLFHRRRALPRKALMASRLSTVTKRQ